MREVLHVTVDPTCRLYRKGVETIGHILSSCESHQWALLKERHDRVAYRLMMSLPKRLNVTVPHSMTWGLTGWQGVAELSGDKATIKVDLSLSTDRQLTSRRLDIVLLMKEERRIVILECAVAWELLLEDQEKKKFYKYQELAADLAT